MAWYRTGTVKVTNGSNVVEGTGCAWIANAQVGWAMLLPDGRVYEIAGISADNFLTLGENYRGTNATGQPYAIFPTQGLELAVAFELRDLISDYRAIIDGPGAGRFGDGTGVAPSVTFSSDQDTGIYRAGTNVLGLTAGGAASFVSVNGVSLNAADGKGAGWLIDAQRFFPAGGTSIARFGFSFNPYINQGSIGVAGFGAVHFFTNDQLRWSIAGTGGFVPAVDNSLTIGSPTNRVSVVYAATGSINTSDEREKEWRGELTPDELAAAKAIASEIGIFQWLSAIEVKGEHSARLHCGVKAQAVASKLAEHGLDPMRYGFVCHDAWEGTPALVGEDGSVLPAQPAGERYGLRPDELLYFLVAAQEQRLSALEAT